MLIAFQQNNSSNDAVPDPSFFVKGLARETKLHVLRTCSQEFLNERMNSKSSGVNLAATYSHIDSLSGLVGLRKSVL